MNYLLDIYSETTPLFNNATIILQQKHHVTYTEHRGVFNQRANYVVLSQDTLCAVKFTFYLGNNNTMHIMYIFGIQVITC